MAAFRRLSDLARLWRTVRDLKPRMIGYRLIRFFYRPTLSNIPESAAAVACSWPLTSFSPVPVADRYDPEFQTFETLNLPSVSVHDAVWTEGLHGLLWNYHLNSLTWLEAFSTPDARVDTLLERRAILPLHRHADAPYPQSLRIFSLIRYLLRTEIRSSVLLQKLWTDYQQLRRVPEYHLDGNHLLENFLAAYSAALFFGDSAQLPLLEQRLLEALHQQFLQDGGHYERSIHYTAQLTASMLKTLGIAQLTGNALSSLEAQLTQLISRALGWMEALQFSDGSFPAFGDSHSHLLPSLNLLLQSAAELNVFPQVQPVSDSGYYRFRNAAFDCIINAGSPAPAHQPGHAHADATSFCLHVEGRPLIVDTGISTYERNQQRLSERQSAAHNVLQPPGEDSAEVWAAFRMGRKPQVTLLERTSRRLVVQHDGFRKHCLLVSRVFDFEERCFTLTERVSGTAAGMESRLHFHPDVIVTLVNETTFQAEGLGLQIRFSGFKKVSQFTYDWCGGFNLRRPATALVAVLQQPEASIFFQTLSFSTP